MIRLSYKTIATHDLYFREPLRDLISESFLSQKRPIQRVGDNCFQTEDCLIILRYMSKREQRYAFSRKWRRCYYLIDDDFAILDKDRSIPDDYRLRLLKFREQVLPQIISLADIVVAPNPRIFGLYPKKHHILLDPCALHICKNTTHFDADGPTRILFPGTRSHLCDLTFLSDLLAQICRRDPNIHLVTYMGSSAPANLQGIGNIEHRKAKSWNAFKRDIALEQFHVALVPLLDTAFNQSRSINKILDCAAVGAAGLFSPVGRLADLRHHPQAPLLIDSDLSIWEREIHSLINDRQKARNLAMSGVALAENVGSPARVRQFWLNELGIEP